MNDCQVRRVAVIGAGISGVLSAGHLIALGIEVTVFERNEAPGGVWVYDERKPPEPSYPSMKASRADLIGTDRQDPEKFLLQHAPPGPCYYNLKNNVPTPLLEVTLKEWPKDTPDFVKHQVVQQYIEEMSMKAQVHDATIYGARVRNIGKTGENWTVSWSTLQQNGESKITELNDSSCFDAVVVATGHYHAPRIPEIPGLSETKKRYGSRIIHSKEYRLPEDFRDKNILLVGGGVSSVDIANDLSPFAETIYQSTRDSHFDLDPIMLPKNGLRVGDVSFIEIHDHDGSLLENEPLPISIHLVTGQRLHGIHFIMLCTGYHITLPFLTQYHSDETSLQNANETILVTDGTQVHNLHKDIFYLPDPTLAFVGLPLYTFTFSVFDFQAIVVAQILSGIVELPDEVEMRDEYNKKVEEVGLGKTFHSLQSKEESYVSDLLSWVNTSRSAQGLAPIEGFSPKWYAAKEALRQRYREQIKKPENDTQ
ncbi:hypothetical protein N7465_005589 [Penicillium sp. CMV-2018d]|nr:hypothetical protein N7465_005589 [Penicillium sp. CMV-2018d]